MSRKFLVINICHIEIIICNKIFITVNILGQISHKEIKITTGGCKVSIKHLAKDNYELFEIEYLLKLRQYSPEAQDGQTQIFLYLPDSIEIASVKGLTLWCPEINQSKRPLAW